MRDPILFGDYRTALNEFEPRVYEDIQDYDACKALFQVLASGELGTFLVHEHLESLYRWFSLILFTGDPRGVQREQNQDEPGALRRCTGPPH